MNGLITKEYLSILDVYTKQVPNFLNPFFESKVIQRLSDISQSCGTGYCKYYDYKFNQSRLDHSLGVAFIIYNFTKDIKQTLAGFFHDISHSVFSHVGDYLLGDSLNQESSEQYTTKLIMEDQIIMTELQKLGILVEEIDDYTKYVIADNPGPQLSADRLEYTLSSAITLGIKSIEDIQKMYHDIRICVNEKGEQELGFMTKEIAEEFGILSVENDEFCFSSYESVVSMSFLAEILRYMLDKKMIEYMDLYKLTESEIIEIIENNKDIELRKMWNYFINLSQYKIDKIKPETNQYFVSSKVKRRYIDPLVQVGSQYVRLSNLSESFFKIKDYHLNKKEEWIRLNYIFCNM